MKKKIWLNNPVDHDYPAAQDYLELIMTTEEAASYAEKLKETKTIVKKAKDIFRASKLHLLEKNNFHVNLNLKKIRKGIALSPILLIRYNNKLVVADGFHRMCAAYYLTEDLSVPCRLV